MTQRRMMPLREDGLDGMTPKPNDSSSGPETASGGSNRWAYLALGSELAGSVLVPVLLGIWADAKFGWGPWGVVSGAALGMIAAGSTLVRLMIRSQEHKIDRHSEH